MSPLCLQSQAAHWMNLARNSDQMDGRTRVESVRADKVLGETIPQYFDWRFASASISLPVVFPP